MNKDDEDTFHFERKKWEIENQREEQKLAFEQHKFDAEQKSRDFDLALKREELRRSKWAFYIQTVAIIGGVVTIILALVQYRDNSVKETRQTLVEAMRLTDTPQYRAFLHNLQTVYSEVEPQVNAPAYEYYAARNNPAKAYEYFSKNVLVPYRLAFDNVIAYFDMLADYTKAGPCYLEAVRINVSQEAGLFIWYFEPIFEKYAEFRNVRSKDLFSGLYTIATLGGPDKCVG